MKQHPIHRHAFIAALSLIAVSTFYGPSLSANSLEEKNPFLPEGYGVKKPEPPKPVVATSGPISREIEFRGIVQLNGVYQFSVFNKSEQKGYWLNENQTEAGISIRGYDPDSQSITLTLNGRSERLSLMSESDAPLPVATSKTAPTGKRNPVPALPPGLQNANNNNKSENKRRVIPRRRVILPKK